MEKQILIAYYSWSGNTRKIAELIHKKIDGNLFEIIPEKEYPSSYWVVVEQAKKEIQAGFKPKLKYKIDLEKYEIVFLGTPNWWSTIAPPVATFLTEYDFSGKIIAPFCTHGGGGQGRIKNYIQKLCPNANILSLLSIHEREVEKAEERVSEWLRNIGILK
ncbi:MAG: flavodoxin [Dictyoglomus sp. NZ13-RE01]|nr:MAG: flavodoxin [Dictyoglomus sp. NZ13-RE01]